MGRRGMALWAGIAALGLLAACSRDSREADIKQCIAQAQRQASQGQSPYPDESAEERHDRLGNDIAACMEKLGYRHDDGAMTDQRCVNDVDYNAFCYVPRR